MKFPHRLRHFEAAQMDAQQCLQLDDGHIKAAVRLAKASKVNWRKRPWVTGRLERFFRESEVKGGEYIRYSTFVLFGEEVLHWFTKTFGYEVSYDVQLRISLGTSLPEFLAFVVITISGHRAWWNKALGLMSQAALPLSRILAKPGRLNGEIQDWDGWMATSNIQQFGLGEGYQCYVPSNLCSSKMYIISRIHYIRHVNDYETHFIASMKFTKWRSWNLRMGGAGMVFGSWNLEILWILWGGKPGRFIFFNPNWHETYHFKTENTGGLWTM